jgi:hypothetical protein
MNAVALLALVACSRKSGPFVCDASATIAGYCSDCVDEKCSDLLPFCERNADCACMEQCLRERGVGAVDACLSDLGLESPPIGFAQVEECVGVACPDEEDECSTPADWVPPNADLVCDGLGTGTIAGGTEPDCAFTELAFDPDGDVLQLVSEDGQVCARVERHAEGAGSLANTTWVLDEIWVGPIGGVAHVASDLCWYSSHHNFQDWVHVWTGTRHYDLALKEDGHGGPRRYHLYVFEEGTLEAEACPATASGVGCIAGPIVLEPYGGG